jgi:hypothetical protein
MPSKFSVSEIGKILAISSGVLGVISTAVFCYLAFAFGRAPLKANHAAGFVVPWNDHGVYHYALQFEYAVFTAASICTEYCLIAFFIGAGTYKGWGLFERS